METNSRFAILLTLFMFLFSICVQADDNPSKLTVNGVEVKLNVNPIEQDGHLLYPLRPVENTMHGLIFYNSKLDLVIVVFQDRIFTYKIGDTFYRINGWKRMWSTMPVETDVGLFVPIRDLAESFGGTVDLNTNQINLLFPPFYKQPRVIIELVIPIIIVLAINLFPSKRGNSRKIKLKSRKAQGNFIYADKLVRQRTQKEKGYKPLKVEDLQGNSNQIISRVIRDIVEVLNKYPDLKGKLRPLLQLAEDAERPLLVVIMGEFKTGKSSFINTLLDAPILKVDSIPATAAVTLLTFGDKPELILHNLNGSKLSLSFDMLSVISAEGDAEGERIRRDLSYLEVKCPCPLLQNVTIVDTPGLNASVSGHTDVTERFKDRADVVLWLFSSMSVGTRTDAGKIQSLREDLKPIAIINKMDELDEDEDSPEVFLAYVKNRLGDTVQKVIGVSTLLANSGRMQKNTDLWKASGWEEIENLLYEELSSNSEWKKTLFILRNFVKVEDELRHFLSEGKKVYDQAYNFVYENETALRQLNNEYDKIKSLHYDWSHVQEQTIIKSLWRLGDIPESVPHYQKLNEQKAIFAEVGKVLSRESDQLSLERRELENKIGSHNKTFETYEKQLEVYNKSGLFGGRPWFDWDGKGRRLEQWGKRLDQSNQELNLAVSQLDSRNEAFFNRKKRSDREVYEFSRLVVSDLYQTMNTLSSKIQNVANTKKLEQEKLSQLAWIKEVPSILDQLSVSLTNMLLVLNKRYAITLSSPPTDWNTTIMEVESFIEHLSRREKTDYAS